MAAVLGDESLEIFRVSFSAAEPGTVAAFVVTLPLLLTGHRLMSIAWGLVARTVVLLVGAATLLVREVPGAVWAAFHGIVLRESARFVHPQAIPSCIAL